MWKDVEKMKICRAVIKMTGVNYRNVYASFVKRGFRVRPDKIASHFLSGGFVLQNAYLANT